MRVGPQRSRPACPRHFAQALHFARLPGRAVGGMSIFRKYRLGVALEILMSKVFEHNRTVYLIDLQGELVHTWQLPYAPGLSGYLTERGTLLYNGRTSENNFLSRFPFKGGVVLEADWNSKVLWELRHPDHHHVGILLRNGNVLLNCLGTVPAEIARQVN